MKYKGNTTEVYEYNEKDFEELTIMFEGSYSAEMNEGYGYTIQNGEDILAEGWGFKLKKKGRKTSPIASSWKALQLALSLLVRMDIKCERLIIRSSSTTVIYQSSGEWKIKKGIYKDVAKLTMETYPEIFRRADFQFIPKSKIEYCWNLSHKYKELLQ